MSITTVRLKPETEKTLEELAEQMHRSKGWLIKEAVEEYLSRKQLEQARWQETLAAMESAVQGKVVDSAEVHAWLQSWGNEGESVPPKIRK